MEQKHMFTNKMIADLLIPVVLEQLLNSIMGTADTMMVSNVGSAAISAVSLVDSINVLVIQAFSALAAGGAIVCAQYIGQKNVKRANESARQVLFIITAISVVISLICLVFQKPMLRLIFGSVEAEVMRASEIYFFYTALSFPFIAAYDSAASIFRAQDNTKGPMLISMISNVMNIAGNAMLIWGFHMGVAGVAIATVVSQMISCVLVLRCLYQTESAYQLRFSKLTMKGAYLKQIFLVGIPAGIQSTVINFSNVLLQSSVNSFGSVAMAGYTAANNIFGFLYAAVNSVTQACMSFTSQNFGVGKWKRMDKVLVNCIVLTVGVALVLGGGAYVFGPELLRIYTSDPEVIKCGMEVLLYTTVTYFMCGLMDLFPGALRGMGHSGVPMILSIIGTVGTRIVWIFGLFPHNRSLSFLFISYPVSWILTILMQVICFYFVRRKVHRNILTQG